ncbi:MAG: HAMP domain-containing protein [Candidatus Pacearchaeota archaeon]|nr:HAMP domain-containing protein [Candidatus Pacearchaeota archaeon]
MMKEAKTFGRFLLINIESIALQRNLTYEENEEHIESLIYSEFEKAIEISRENESFHVDEIILVNPGYIVEIGYPEDLKGMNFSSHQDIVENFTARKFKIALEKEVKEGRTELDIDIVSFLELDNHEQRVLEIKLNFEETLKLLRKQYQTFEVVSIIISFLIFLLMMIVLLFIIRRTAINPAVKLSHALEKVAKGDLNVKMEHHSVDEFGVMSTRFNEMITGLKEKLHLSRYVSTSTIDAVTDAVKSEEHFHKPRRKKTTVFFSDIRGFTAYS